MPRQDPRLEDIPRSVNEEVRDRTVRHLLFLTRVQNREADRILRFLDRQVLPDLLSKIERRLERIRVTGIDPGPVTTRRLQELASIISQETRIGIRAARQRVKDTLTALAVDEATFERGVLAQSIPVEVELVAPSVQTLREVVTKRPMDGALLDDWFDRLDRDTQQRINQAIRLGVAEGETVPQVMRRLRGTRAANFEDGILAISRRNAETVVRSAVIHTSAQARQRVFEENQHVIKKLQWVSTLDSRTCVTAGTLVQTPHGEQPIESLAVGDDVLSPSGNPRKIIHMARRRVTRVLQLRLSNGRTLRCTPDHLLQSPHGFFREAQTFRVGEQLTRP